MATQEITLKWLRRKTDESEHGRDNLPDGICPVLGLVVWTWSDWLGSEALRAEYIEPLADALAKSADPAQEDARRAALAQWLQDVAWPAWLQYAALKPEQTIRDPVTKEKVVIPGEDLDDAFAEAIAENKGNGVASVNSFMGASGVSPAAFACAGVRLGLTKKDRGVMLARARVNRPLVRATRRDGTTEGVSPLKIKSRCFRAAFVQPADPSDTIELLQASFLELLESLLGV